MDRRTFLSVVMVSPWLTWVEETGRALRLTVEGTSALCRQAGEFAERYRLRACDSVHLAAFAEVAREA